MDLKDLLDAGAGEPAAEPGAPAWMATFADMSTLLLTFFVVLLSFANTDAQKFRDMLGSVKDAFGVQKETPASSAPATGTGAEPGATRDAGALPAAPPSEQMFAIVEALFQDLGPGAEVTRDERGVTVRFDGTLLFLSGSADLRPEARPLVDRVARLLGGYSLDCHILGHTDGVPIQTPKFDSNWELSGARAAAALRHLLTRGVSARRLVAIGFADSRPLARNDTPEGRARNRRVEFVFRPPEPAPPVPRQKNGF